RPVPRTPASYETPPATPVAKRSSAPPRRTDGLDFGRAASGASVDGLGSGRAASGASADVNATPPTHSDLDAFLAEARVRAASDLHLVAGRPALFRVAGELVPSGDPVAALQVESMVMPRVPARLVHELQRDGSCDFAIEHSLHGRFRVNVSRQRTGLKASL